MSEKQESTVDSLNRSGHNLHLRVLNSIITPNNLISRFDEVLASPYYPDQITGLAREIDIIIKNEISVPDFSSPRNEKIKQIKMFIECKYLSQPVVFLENKCEYGLMIDIWKKQFGVRDLSNKFKFADSRYKHFLENQRVAIICEPFKELFQAFDSCVKAKRAEERNESRSTINYLWVVVDGDMFRVKGGIVKNKGEKYEEADLEKIEHELMIINYTKDGLVGNDRLFVEFIHESKFIDFLDKIWDECKLVH